MTWQIKIPQKIIVQMFKIFLQKISILRMTVFWLKNTVILMQKRLKSFLTYREKKSKEFFNLFSFFFTDASLSSWGKNREVQK